jgi:hypothetical protein
MDWKLGKLTYAQARAFYPGCYVGAFFSVILPHLLAEASPEPDPKQDTPIDIPPNPYIPLAIRLKEKDL